MNRRSYEYGRIKIRNISIKGKKKGPQSLNGIKGVLRTIPNDTKNRRSPKEAKLHREIK